MRLNVGIPFLDARVFEIKLVGHSFGPFNGEGRRGDHCFLPRAALRVSDADVAGLAERFEVTKMVVTAAPVALSVAWDDVIDGKIPPRAALHASPAVTLSRCLASCSPIVLP